MIAQGLQQLTQLVRDSDVIRQHELEDHPDIAFFTYRGDVKLVELPPLPRTHFVSSIGSLVEATKGFGKHGCPVWVSFSDVIALIDDEVNPDFQGRRSANICLSLKPSPIWNALVVATKAHSQQDLVDLLRHDFSDAMISPKLLDKVRQLKFSSQREEQGSFQQQNIEMGKKVAAQVAGSSPFRCSVAETILALLSVRRTSVAGPCPTVLGRSWHR